MFGKDIVKFDGIEVPTSGTSWENLEMGETYILVYVQAPLFGHALEQ